MRCDENMTLCAVVQLHVLTAVRERQVCRGSHRLRAFERLRAYASSRVGADGTRSGWLSDDGVRAAGLCRIVTLLLLRAG